jgi:beta-propeller repeat-containing protein
MIDFPTANPLQPTNGGLYDTFDAYIAKFDINGAFIYSTYFGGSSSDFGKSISLDGAGNIYLLGDTSSTNFPTAASLYSTRSGGIDLFVAKLNPSGSAILYSTYLGGSGNEEGKLKVDSQGNAYITDYTESPDFPTVNALQTQQYPGGQCNLPSDVIPYIPSDAFVTKLNATGSSLVYSSYIGGLCRDAGADISLDRFGNVYLVGSTASANFPITPGAFQTIISPAQTSARDAFIVKINQ